MKLNLNSNKIIIHKGFDIAYKSIEKEIVSFLNNYFIDNKNDLNKKLVVTGHSLGGALATLFVYYNSSLKNLNLITFGSPLVGNKKFVDNFNYNLNINLNKHYRVENGSDIITKIPLSILGYNHIGNSDNRIILQPIKKYLYMLGNVKVLKKYIFEPPTILSDHCPLNYLINLN